MIGSVDTVVTAFLKNTKVKYGGLKSNMVD